MGIATNVVVGAVSLFFAHSIYSIVQLLAPRVPTHDAEGKPLEMMSPAWKDGERLDLTVRLLVNNRCVSAELNAGLSMCVFRGEGLQPAARATHWERAALRNRPPRIAFAPQSTQTRSTPSAHTGIICS